MFTSERSRRTAKAVQGDGKGRRLVSTVNVTKPMVFVRSLTTASLRCGLSQSTTAEEAGEVEEGD